MNIHLEVKKGEDYFTEVSLMVDLVPVLGLSTGKIDHTTVLYTLHGI